MMFNSLSSKAIHLLIFILLMVVNIKGQTLPDQKINLKVEAMPLGEVFRTLEQKTNFTFSYFNQELPLDSKVTLDIRDETLLQILETLSNNFKLSFTRINNIITVKKKEEKPETNPQQHASHTYGTLRGLVRDSVTSEVLPYANVYIPEIKSGASTDNHGLFIIPSIPAQKEYTIVTSFVGYLPQRLKVYIKENKINDIIIDLSRTTIEVGNIEVTGKRIYAENATAQKISMSDVFNMPQGVETDVMRYIQLQPGVQSAGDVSARYYVRGGASNENLVLLNGTPIYNPFHALGIFSVIDPDMINGIDFYKGGFGAKYDGRLSSVTDIITKDGNKNKYGLTAAVSQLTVKSAVEGPIPDGSFIITGRKSFSNEIIKKFTNNSSIPIDFYDASFKVNYSLLEFPSLTKLTLFGFTSKDNIDYKSKLRSNFNWSNSFLGISCLSTKAESPVTGEFTFYYSTFSGNEIPNSSQDRHIENQLYDLGFKGDITYVRNDKSEYYGGININNIKTNLLLSNASGLSNSEGAESLAASAYAGYKLQSVNNLKVDLGSRLNIFTLSEGMSSSLEPRLNVIYNILPVLDLKAAWGLYKQELVTISDEDEVLALFEPWMITPKYLKPSTAIHYIVGTDYYMTEKIKISIEGYYKIMHNLAVLNDQIVYPTDPQLVNGEGESHGAELSLNYQNSFVNAQISYAYSWTTKKVGDIEYHPRYDCRDAIKIILNFDLGKNWRAGISWNYNSGLPFTQIYGYYNKFIPSGIFTNDSSILNFEYYPILADRNAARLPDYHRLDLSLSKEFQLGFMNLGFSLNVINVYDRKNFFYFDMKTGERVNMLPFFPTIEIKAEL